MLEYQGKYNKAQVMIDEIDLETVRQIYSFLNHPAFAHTYIVIMPDCHAGAGSCIGFTMKMNDYIIPNIVGVDIGCGVLAYKLQGVDGIRLSVLDSFIKTYIPSGYSHHSKPVVNLKDSSDWWKYQEVCEKLGITLGSIENQIGTLGGGNHFIEVDIDEKDNYWLVVHTGSRNFGLRVANYHQNRAKELLKRLFVGADAYKTLEYLPLEHGGNDYLIDMEIAQNFALRNRETIARTILTQHFGFKDFDINKLERIESVHNYINFEDDIIRKGAISAHNGERVIIPFNMRDGILVGTGRENKRWNFSAPHGAGRVLSRKKAKQQLDVEEFKKQMEVAGIYTTTATDDTLDEAPGAYKDKDLIIDAIQPTLDVDFFMKPIYNFKSSGD